MDHLWRLIDRGYDNFFYFPPGRNIERILRSLLRGKRTNLKKAPFPYVEDTLQQAAGYSSILSQVSTLSPLTFLKKYKLLIRDLS